MTVDEILDEYDYKLHNLDRDEIKSALYDLILKEVIGQDGFAGHSEIRNELREEMRNKLAKVFGVSDA